ncbi:histidine phosphatase family protein [Phototrophicus methaneseepsis]|uniref:Histidine phosphatase family protein n=1 Tax=Phototrophicus methaneseepsis TaxID=2710758 RepID=A0A7S8IEV3_9CHLR|nr:histidine phosphatase family protein [Phototrophicus methaneseepsis]QPC82844.1 histidine phosphatase family protein [Phototrophicus methaneseepsis]
MQLYLIRHAQSYNNALEDPRNRVADPDLSDIGFEQARLLGEYAANAVELTSEWPRTLSPWQFTHLYVSPMKRTLQTAQPLAKAVGIKPEVWIDIHEHGGIFLANEDGTTTGFGGLSSTEITSTFADYTVPETITDTGWWNPENGEETIPDFVTRAVRVAMALRDRAQSDDIIGLVSHAAFLDALVKALLNQAPIPPSDLFYLHYNTGISRFDFTTEFGGRTRMMFFNRMNHLPLSLQTT